MDHLIDVIKECNGPTVDENGLPEDYEALIAPWQGYFQDAEARQDEELLSQMKNLREKVSLLLLEWQGSFVAQRGLDLTPSRTRRGTNPVTQRLRAVRIRYIGIKASDYSRFQLDPYVFARLKASCAVHVENEQHGGQASKMKLNFA